eukprot:5742311-Pleurochrysis_carterae.AAC.1
MGWHRPGAGGSARSSPGSSRKAFGSRPPTPASSSGSEATTSSSWAATWTTFLYFTPVTPAAASTAISRRP